MGLVTAWPRVQKHRHFHFPYEDTEMDVLWIIVIVLVVLWVAGMGFAIGGNLIHLLLLIAAIIVIYRLITGRKPIP